VRTAVRLGWLRLTLALLLVLLGMTATAAPGTASAGPRPSTVVGTRVSVAVATHDDPYRALLLAALARQAPTTTLPDDGWASCPHATGGHPPQGWSPSSGIDSTDTVSTAPAACRGRAPPYGSAGRSAS
jgi:hypothetical protein